MAGKRAEMIVRLLERDDRARAAGVADVDALDRGLERERADQVRVEARAQPARARRRREEVDVARRPPRSPQRAAHRFGADLDGPAAEALPELIDGLVRRERRGIDVEVAAIDLAVGEEPRALPLVAGQAQERRLLPAPGRN